MVECLIPSDRKHGGVLVVAKGTPRTFRSMWVGRTEESDEHLVVNEIGHVVRARTVRRCVENENTGSDVIKLNATPLYLKADGHDVEVRERWTPTPGCRACESAHANKHLVRCEARRYEYRLKYGRNPPVTTRRVHHEPETVPEGTSHGESETNPVSDRERQPASSSCTATFASENNKCTVTEKDRHKVRHRESSVTTHVPSQPMDVSDMSARVSLSLKRSPFEVKVTDQNKDIRLEDPDEAEVTIDEVRVNEEVEHPMSEVFSRRV